MYLAIPLRLNKTCHKYISVLFQDDIYDARKAERSIQYAWHISPCGNQTLPLCILVLHLLFLFLTIMFETLRPWSQAPEWLPQPLNFNRRNVSFCPIICTVMYLDPLECIHHGLWGITGLLPFVETERPESPSRLKTKESKEQEEWTQRAPSDGPLNATLKNTFCEACYLLMSLFPFYAGNSGFHVHCSFHCHLNSVFLLEHACGVGYG